MTRSLLVAVAMLNSCTHLPLAVAAAAGAATLGAPAPGFLQGQGGSTTLLSQPLVGCAHAGEQTVAMPVYTVNDHDSTCVQSCRTARHAPSSLAWDSHKLKECFSETSVSLSKCG